MSLWKELRLLRLATFARVLRTAAAANARPLVSLHAKQAAVLQISSAKRLTSNSVGISGAVRVRAAFLCSDLTEVKMVHQYKLNGYNIVLDTCSGSVHSVDDVAYDIIAMYKTASREEIVNAVMKKYGDRPDVTRDDVLLCIDDVESLEKAASSSQRTVLKILPRPLRSVPVMLLRRCVCTLLTPATSTAHIALQARVSITVTEP